MTTVAGNIPLDLTIEILLRLPGESVLRFRCVSKTWCSIIRSRRFADAFMSLSLSRPRLLLAFSNHSDNRLKFFSSPNQNSSFPLPSSMVAAKDNTLTMPEIRSGDHIVQRNSVRGFVCCSLRTRFAVCNPTTRQVISLPEKHGSYVSLDHECYQFLGYDPSKDQYKVLRLDMDVAAGRPIEHSVCTLGGRRRLSCYSWRSIKSSILYYGCNYNGLCIDGIVYFEAGLEPLNNSKTVSSFDVGSEQLGLIKTPENFSCGFLTNYLGKLAAYDPIERNGCYTLWVLDDVKNHVWSERVFVFSSLSSSLCWDLGLSFAGMTAAGEIVLVPMWYYEPFEIFCYNVEKKVERRVRVKGLEGNIYDGVSSCPVGQESKPSASCCYVDNITYL
uniref:F-box protein n=2 Tax=Noccaea caerulescens TaxID=107243 RepID=A0A1J3DSE6_NOCCA